MADLFRLKQTRINVHPDVHRLTGCRKGILASSYVSLRPGFERAVGYSQVGRKRGSRRSPYEPH